MAVKTSRKCAEYKWPLLMEYNLCGMSYVVLMTESGVGVVVDTNTKEHPVGEYRTDWIMETSTGIKLFKPYPNIVFLEN